MLRRAGITIGIDESGTGSWCGPATCCAFAIYDVDEPWLVEAGAKDSKRVKTQAERLKVCAEILPCAIIAKVEFMSVEALSRDHQSAWRNSIGEAAAYVLYALGPRASHAKIVIDGKEDKQLTAYFIRQWDILPKYQIKGDTLTPAVSAASLYAKMARTSHMRELAKQYPGYGWEVNDGYYANGAQLEAVKRHGITPMHRRIQPLLHYFGDQHEVPTRRATPPAVFVDPRRHRGQGPQP